MASLQKRIADDLYKHHGALISVTDIMNHFKICRQKAVRIVVPLQEIGHGTGKRYFYEDVAEAIARM